MHTGHNNSTATTVNNMPTVVILTIDLIFIQRQNQALWAPKVAAILD